MGYTTDFYGHFTLDKPLTPEHAAYLKAFNETRRMKRDASKTSKLPDTRREAVKLPIGNDAEYYVGSVDDGNHGQGKEMFGARDADIVDFNSPPSGQPGLWCGWTVADAEGDSISDRDANPTRPAQSIVWDGGEKFYEYVKWLEYLIEHFLKPWGYKLNGDVTWQGEESDDRGMIRVTDNKVKTGQGRLEYDFG